MKRLFLAAFAASSLLFSFDLSSMTSGSVGNPTLPATQSTVNAEIQKKNRTYASLIEALKQSPNADHAMLLGVLYLNGSDTPDSTGATLKPNLELAKKYLEKAINLGNYKAAAVLGTLYAFDDRFRRGDYADKARYYLSLAVKNGVYEATAALASVYFFYDKDVDKGLKTLIIGDKHNIAAAQLALATLYGYGSKDLGIPQDKFLGNQFLEKACSNPKKPQKVKEFCSSKYVIHNNKKRGTQ